MLKKFPSLLPAALFAIFCLGPLPALGDHTEPSAVAPRQYQPWPAQPENSLQTQTGPALGDTIDLTAWRTHDGRTLAQVMKRHSLAMVLLINPSCGTCAGAKEGFRTLRESVGKPRIPYYVLMIPESSDAQKFFSYAKSLQLDVESFVWSSTETKAPATLATMVVPSHLLLTSEGLVVDKWPGTTPNE